MTADALTVTAQIGSRVPDVRTALLLLSPQAVGHEADIAMRLGCRHVDYHAWRATRIQANERFLQITASLLEADLDALCSAHHYLDILLIANFDLALAALSGEDRQKLWLYLRGGFRRRTPIVFALPQAAEPVLPWPGERELWIQSQRLAVWEGQNEE